MKMSDNVQQLFAGLVKLRAKIKQPTKSKSNPFFKSKYVDLEGVQKAIDDAKEGTGIDYTQFIETSPDGMTGVSTMIYSDKGDYIISDPLYLRPAKNDPQGNGSVITYSRRYQLSSMFGISSDIDDDGNSASGNYQQNGRQTQHRQYKRSQTPQQTNDVMQAKKATYAKTVKQLAVYMGTDPKTAAEEIKNECEKDARYKQADRLGQLDMSTNIANRMLTTLQKEAANG